MNKHLQMRRNAMKLLENITTVRGIVRNGRFNQDLFDQVNGDDKALESLVGHQVIFAMLDEHEKVNLRRDIMSKLTENQIATYGKIRESMEAYFAEIDKAMLAYKPATENQESILGRVGRIKKDMLDKLPQGVVDTGCYTKLGVENCAAAFEVLSDFLNRVSPVLTRILADADNENDEEDTVEPPKNPDVTEGSEAAPPAELPEDPETTPDHEILVDPSQDDDAAADDIKAGAEENRSMENCAPHFIVDEAQMGTMGYDKVETIVDTIKKIDDVIGDYVAAVKNFRDVMPVATCVSDDLVKGNEKFMGAIDAVMGLINKAENIRSKMETTKTTLLDALDFLERN